MGKLIVIEGLDGSGKGTQAELLAKNLEAQGKAVRKISFPDYVSDSSALVKMYLSGQFGSRPEDVNAYAASTFYAVDRFASFKRDWGGFYEDGGIVVADRYTTSNAVHQCSKLPQEQWDAFLAWLFDFEYHLLGMMGDKIGEGIPVFTGLPHTISPEALRNLGAQLNTSGAYGMYHIVGFTP